LDEGIDDTFGLSGREDVKGGV